MGSLSRVAVACQPPEIPRTSKSYTAVPNELLDSWRDWGLRPIEVLVYAALLRRKWSTTDPFPSIKTLCRDVGASVSTVQRAISMMENLGLITVEPRIGEHGGIVSNTYHLHLVAQVTGGTTRHGRHQGGRR